jgi:hypothetical protein
MNAARDAARQCAARFGASGGLRRFRLRRRRLKRRRSAAERAAGRQRAEAEAGGAASSRTARTSAAGATGFGRKRSRAPSAWPSNRDGRREGKREVWRSLGTRDRREAERRFHAAMAKLDAFVGAANRIGHAGPPFAPRPTSSSEQDFIGSR